MKTLLLATAAVATLGLSPAIAQTYLQGGPVEATQAFPSLETNADGSAHGPAEAGVSNAEVLANQNAGQFFSDETTLSEAALKQLQRIALED